MLNTIISHMKDFIKEKELDINLDEFQFEVSLYEDQICKQTSYDNIKINFVFIGYELSDALLIRCDRLKIYNYFIINSIHLKDVAIAVLNYIQKCINNEFITDLDKRPSLYHLYETDPKDYIYGKNRKDEENNESTENS